MNRFIRKMDRFIREMDGFILRMKRFIRGALRTSSVAALRNSSTDEA